MKFYDFIPFITRLICFGLALLIGIFLKYESLFLIGITGIMIGSILGYIIQRFVKKKKCKEVND